MSASDGCIVVDARELSPRMTGVGRYVAGLLSGLAELDLPRHVNVLAMEEHASLVREIVGERASMSVVSCPVGAVGGGPWSLRSQMQLPRLLNQLRAAVYHCPYLYAPLLARGVRIVITVHDLIPIVCREHLTRSRKGRFGFAWNFWCSRQHAKADAIVTVSEQSRRDLVQHARIDPAKITRIYNGVQRHETATDSDELRSRWNLRGRIISTISRHDPYKNLAMLVRAFALLRSRLSEECTLVIGGRVDPRYQEPQRLVDKLRLREHVVFTDYLSDDDRVGLLRMSDVFVYPSLYEGFGLPPLETMAEGVPVVSSNASSLPEVLGDAALLVDPHDDRRLADAMHHVLRDSALAQRLREAGPRQAARFTWRDSAAAHVALYESLLRA